MYPYLQHFGLTHPPLDKKTPSLWDDGALAVLEQRFQWLLESPGIGPGQLAEISADRLDKI